MTPAMVHEICQTVMAVAGIMAGAFVLYTLIRNL